MSSTGRSSRRLRAAHGGELSAWHPMSSLLRECLHSPGLGKQQNVAQGLWVHDWRWGDVLCAAVHKGRKVRGCHVRVCLLLAGQHGEKAWDGVTCGCSSAGICIGEKSACSGGERTVPE